MLMLRKCLDRIVGLFDGEGREHLDWYMDMAIGWWIYMAISLEATCLRWWEIRFVV